MPSLLERQRAVYRAIRSPSGRIDADLGAARTGLQVYRNNARELVRKALLADFPVVARLSGEACFGWLCAGYARRHPSRSGDLQRHSERFPDFLAGRYGTGRYAWLADVARLELAMVRASIGADAPAIAPQALLGLGPQQLAGLRLALHPSASLLASRWPVLSIWRANLAAQVPEVHLDAGGERVLVWRAAGGVHAVLLDRAGFALLERLHSSGSPIAASGAALAADPGVDLTAAWGVLLPLGVLCTTA